jgi:aromatic-L-amino-acid/L-tryptophan decarboxylase
VQCRPAAELAGIGTALDAMRRAMEAGQPAAFVGMRTKNRMICQMLLPCPLTGRSDLALLSPFISTGKRRLNMDTMANRGPNLDPADWPGFRAQAHRMLDDIVDYLEQIRDQPVWRPIPEEVRSRFRESLPRRPTPLADVHKAFMRDVLPYATGNVHPAFMGWVHGGGNPVGMLAEMLAGGLNANLGGRDHMPIEVERQIARWMAELFGFPATASGLFVTGTSMANLMAVLVARTAALGTDLRRRGLAEGGGAGLMAYSSAAAHGCVAQAMDLSGSGSQALHKVAVDPCHRIDLDALAATIEVDRRAGLAPFLIVGTAGTVDVGAIDDLAGLADLARREGLWLHVDAAYGALAMLAPDLAPRLAGIERADSIAFDFHKWGQVPYDAGFLLVRDMEKHGAAFAAPAAYLRREARGLAGGSPWPCDFGPDLSRGFRALKTWFTLKVHGAEALGAVISRTCALARHLEARIRATPVLELLAPAQLNIVCFRYRGPEAGADRLNATIVAALHESGVAAPSTTTIDGRLAIRAAIVNHRTEVRDIDTLVDAVLRAGDTLIRSGTG